MAPSRKLLTAGSGEATEIFSARSVDLTLGSKVAVASPAEASVEAHGSFPLRLKVGASSEAPTFLLRCQPMFAESIPFRSALFHASGVCYDINCFCSYAGIAGAAGGGQFM